MLLLFLAVPVIPSILVYWIDVVPSQCESVLSIWAYLAPPPMAASLPFLHSPSLVTSLLLFLIRILIVLLIGFLNNATVLLAAFLPADRYYRVHIVPAAVTNALISYHGDMVNFMQLVHSI